MPPAMARIPVRSRRQAMDWSLVLISQGIESTIEHPAESGWALIIAASDEENAWKAIQLYRSENRQWPWQRELLQPGLLFDWAALVWVVLVLVFYLLDEQRDLRTVGMMDSTLAAQGQWWRLFTAVWLHADISHLAANASIGVVLLGLCMARYGTGVGLLASYAAGVAGNLPSVFIFQQTHRSLGASGMVMGCLGLLAASSLALIMTRQPKRSENTNPQTADSATAMKFLKEAHPATKTVLAAIAGGVLLFVLLGLTPGTDVLAHLSGFASGLLIGGCLSFVPKLAQRASTNLLAGFFFGLLVALPWWFAFKRES